MLQRKMAARREKRRFDELMACGDVKRLMIDGVWQVPIADRPKGWETLGGKEKDENL